MLKIPWVEKYRPKSLDEVIDHQRKISTLRNLIQRNELTHLLFYGAPGLGKTSLALSLSRELYGDTFKHNTLELNASDDRGIDVVRNRIPNFIKCRSDKIRMVILDEADAMTPDAQNALRRVMENNIRTSRFILICNNIKKIIPEIQSRCVPMRFSPLNPLSIRDRLNTIITEEGVSITSDAINLLSNHLKDFRQVLNSLQCLHYNNIIVNTESSQQNIIPPITKTDVLEFLGVPSEEETKTIYNNLCNDKYQSNVEMLRDLIHENKWNLIELITKMSQKIADDNTLSDDRRYYLISKLARIEFQLINGRDSDIQLMSIVATFVKSRKYA